MVVVMVGGSESTDYRSSSPTGGGEAEGEGVADGVGGSCSFDEDEDEDRCSRMSFSKRTRV